MRYGDHAARLLIIEYERLCQTPEKVLNLVYEFLGEALFEHDFTSVEYDAPEFDAQLGVAGLHKIRPKVELKDRRTILPPDLFDQYINMAFWRDLKSSKANVIAVQSNTGSNAKLELAK